MIRRERIKQNEDQANLEFWTALFNKMKGYFVNQPGASREISGPYTIQKSAPPLVLARLPAGMIAHVVFLWITFQKIQTSIELSTLICNKNRKKVLVF